MLKIRPFDNRSFLLDDVLESMDGSVTAKLLPYLPALLVKSLNSAVFCHLPVGRKKSCCSDRGKEPNCGKSDSRMRFKLHFWLFFQVSRFILCPEAVATVAL